jgi:hypothetical protein
MLISLVLVIIVGSLLYFLVVQTPAAVTLAGG